MEMKAAAKIWFRSEACGFHYTALLSDGDAKTHKFLNSLKIYGPDVEIWKEECINHTPLAKGEKPVPHKLNIGTPINPDYLTKIVPIYQRLASYSLWKGCARERCLTQNIKESLHIVFWSGNGYLWRSPYSSPAKIRLQTQSELIRKHHTRLLLWCSQCMLSTPS
ncbi:uncharacterized protein TNCV_2596901 [Trichonephila clavipes]|nr:uncharacterized protein TNCV_2596901 [Trichonephila clavipes]